MSGFGDVEKRFKSHHSGMETAVRGLIGGAEGAPLNRTIVGWKRGITVTIVTIVTPLNRTIVGWKRAVGYP